MPAINSGLLPHFFAERSVGGSPADTSPLLTAIEFRSEIVLRHIPANADPLSAEGEYLTFLRLSSVNAFMIFSSSFEIFVMHADPATPFTA